MKNTCTYFLSFLCLFFTSSQLQSASNFYDYYGIMRDKTWAFESLIDVKKCDPVLLLSSDSIKDYVSELIDFLKTERYGDPIVTYYGDEENKGYTVVQFIKKSCIIVQCSNKTQSAHINVICSKPYDPTKLVQLTRNFFKSNTAVYHHRVRQH